MIIFETELLTIRNSVKLKATSTNTVLKIHKILENHALLEISQLL